MCGGVATKVVSIRYAWTTYDQTPWGTNSSRLNEDLVFKAAESAEEKGNYNSFSNGKDE